MSVKVGSMTFGNDPSLEDVEFSRVGATILDPNLYELMVVTIFYARKHSKNDGNGEVVAEAGEDVVSSMICFRTSQYLVLCNTLKKSELVPKPSYLQPSKKTNGQVDIRVFKFSFYLNLCLISA